MRFIAPYAIGTWPAWWTLTDEFKDGKWGDKSDELDIIEAYAATAPSTPMRPPRTWSPPHTWGYHAENHEDKVNPIDMAKVGGGGGWAYTPHIYGMLVKRDVFEFYLDNVKVLTLPALAKSRADSLVLHGEPRRGRRLARGSIALRQHSGHVCGLHPCVPLSPVSRTARASHALVITRRRVQA